MKRLTVTLLITCSSIAFWKVWGRELETSRLNAGYLSTFNLRPSTLKGLVYLTFNFRPWTLPNGQSSTGGSGGTSSGGAGTSTVSIGNAPSLVSIAVTPANATINTGSTQQYTATGTYSDGSQQNITQSVTWGSTNTAVATIASGGLATGVAAGSTTIQATLSGITGSTGLTVTSGGGGGGTGGTAGATATQYILAYTAANANPCKIEVSTNSNYSPVVYAVDATKFSGANMDGQTNTGARTFLVGQRTVAQENVSPPSITVAAGAATRSNLALNKYFTGNVTVSYTGQPFVVGDNITVTGMSDATFNTSWGRIMSTSTNSFTYWTIGQNGAIVTSSVGAGGTGYVTGDTGTVTGGGGADTASYLVLAVSGGAVTSFSIAASQAGAGYSVTGGAATTATSGVGSGFTININSVSGTTSGGGTITRANRYSLALQLYTTYYYRLGGPSNTCGANPATGTFATMNWPNGDTWAENFPTDSSGNWVTPSIPETKAALPSGEIIDPITGAVVKPATLYSDSTTLYTDGHSGAERHCSSQADSNGFFHCYIPQGGTGGVGFYGINSSTGEIRYLGVPDVSPKNDCNNTPGIADTAFAPFDPTDPNTFYGICLASGGGQHWILWKATYTGNDAAQSDGTGIAVAAGAVDLTPVGSGYELDVLINNFDSTYNNTLFGYSFAFQGVEGNYVEFNAQRWAQNSPMWDVVLNLGDRLPIDSTCGSTRPNCPRIVAAKTIWANQVAASCTLGSPSYCSGPFGGSPCRWCGDHNIGLNGGSSQGWASTSVGEYKHNNQSMGLFEITLNQGGGMNGTDSTDTITVTSTMVGSCGGVAGDPASQDVPPDGCNFLDQALPGDVFQFEDTNELVMITARNSATSLTIARGCHAGANLNKLCDGTGETAHSNGVKFYAHCWPSFQGNGGIVWNFASDPHGTDTSNTNLVWALYLLGPHGGSTLPWVLEEGGWKVKGNQTWNSAFWQGPLDYYVGQHDTFNGISNYCAGAACYAYPHYFANPVVNWGWDANTYTGQAYDSNHGVGNATKVGGTTYIYKTSFATANQTLPYFSLSGVFKLTDISGPGSVLHDTTADNYKFCLVKVAGECWTGSSPGDAYANLPGTGASVPCATGGEGGFPFYGDWCIENSFLAAAGVNQVGLCGPVNSSLNCPTAANAVGTDPNTGKTYYGMTFSRKIVQGLFAPPRHVNGVHWQDLTNQTWGFWQSCIEDPYENLEHPTSPYSYTCFYQNFALQIPSQPPADGVNRTNFENVSVTIGAGSGGATHAVVTFGYEENEPAKTLTWPRTPHFYCTQYQGQCYYQSGNFGNTSLASATSLPLNSNQTLAMGVPQRVLFYQVEYLNGSNQVVATDPMQVVVIP